MEVGTLRVDNAVACDDLLRVLLLILKEHLFLLIFTLCQCHEFLGLSFILSNLPCLPVDLCGNDEA